MITGDPRDTTSGDRERGFVERLLEADVRRKDIEEAPGLSSYDAAASAALALFERRGRPHSRSDRPATRNHFVNRGPRAAQRSRLALAQGAQW